MAAEELDDRETLAEVVAALVRITKALTARETKRAKREAQAAEKAAALRALPAVAPLRSRRGPRMDS